MCGINGILHLQTQKKVDERILTRMRDSLEHRGPDDKGVFIENNLGLGHRRLSIIDVSSRGHQPFLSGDGRYVMVYNGEIYNFKEFYPELKSNGFDIRTNSDSEVLLKLFQLYGLKMLPRLNGMFAFAVWDRTEKKLTVVRDRMGVKPLYYSFHNTTFYFGSEQKALFTAGVPLKIAQDGLGEYIFNRFVAGENTLYENVKKVLPGYSMTIHENGKVNTEKWWDLKSEIQNHTKIKNPLEWFKTTFDDSVRLRMVSDVPVGVLLSGGLDSSSILASLHEQKYNDLQTFNIGFKEAEHNESHLAKRLSEKFGYGFHTMQLENDLLYDKLIASTYFQDEPIMHLSEPHILALSQLAKPSVKVLLSGEGADEMMGGYVRYKALQYPSLLNSIAAIGHLDFFSKKPRYEKLVRYAQIKNNQDLVMYNSSNIYPNDIANTFGINSVPKNEYRKEIYEDAKSLYPKNLRRQALYFDQHTYLCSLLDRNDRCTMGASVECREPFLDPRLISGLGSLNDEWLFTGKKGKFILKSAMQKKLPEEILKFKKVGLSVPWGDYIIKSPVFKDELDSFSRSPIFEMPYFENINAAKLVQNLQKGDAKMIPYFMPLFMMHIWIKNYATGFSPVLDLIS
ncbi:asparagine synthase (glutamine-hydrolyzing) [Flavobacterium psychrotolerans]|uniref:asparagine synthase (glutamine-hydrolyzing) n=1 Tax=Flavobacterium psychrotolerans TaxID=2169410 RepID=A0A2U1JQD8_9FLAO|nr:asparagine synthase (glutamine-hydrolyzing) [Flavobacterium psychrotolerans]PWA07225.1 asparagine synthase (glutamine-hydrolyzing) [Flavobacterium psychrotolerans]